MADLKELTHTAARRGCTDTERESALNADLVIKTRAALGSQTCQPSAQPAELKHRPDELQLLRQQHKKSYNYSEAKHKEVFALCIP